MHGNEPAGVLALQTVLAQLQAIGGIEAGEFVALAGNLEALRQGCRFVQQDLNRAWHPQRLYDLQNGGRPGASFEDLEQVQLLDAFEEALSRARGASYLLDLHTTSGGGGPFATVSDTLINRDFAQVIPTPMILGLEELVEGTLLEYMNEKGLITAGFESGQHAEEAAADRAEAAIWLVLSGTGLLPPALQHRAEAARKYLERDTASLPRVLEMRYRHHVQGADGFRMMPGYENFQPVSEGEVVATDRKGEVRATEAARILMPLYQEQGEDGFFIVREFNPFWLWLSRPLRRLPIASFIHWLPGIKRDPEDPRVLVVNKRVARIFAVQLFHLLGYRRKREDGNQLRVMARRAGGRV
jgi:predicted deacylase